MRPCLRSVLAAALVAARGSDGSDGSDAPHALTVCTDRDRSCANWARTGECAGENKDAVQALCPMSCRRCEPGCRDLSPHCQEFADRGEMQNNSAWMQLSCQVTTGACLAECHEVQPGACARLAGQGKCQESPQLFAHLCPVACGVCSSRCVDRNDSCPGWAATGRCDLDDGAIRAECGFSCGVCQGRDGSFPDRLADARCADADGCDEVPAGRCSHADVSRCPRTCGACADVCMDVDDSCADWVEGGECARNPEAMGQLCPFSCLTCAQLHHHTGSGGWQKDEL